MARDRKYRFYEKPHAVGGRFALIIAGISLLLFIVCVVLSFISRGNGGQYIGGIGLIGGLLSVCGFFAGIRSFREPETTPALSIAGTIACGMIMLGWATIFLAGL